MNIQVPSCCYRISVKALIKDQNKRFLLIKHSNGYRELPGGGLELGENPQKGLEREVYEEMGLKTTFIAEFPSYFITTPYIENIYIANLVYDTFTEHLDFVQSEECIEIRFFTKEEALKEKNIYENVVEFIKAYKEL